MEYKTYFALLLIKSQTNQLDENGVAFWLSHISYIKLSEKFFNKFMHF